MKVLLIDGYVVVPGCLGVPPYLAPYPRYIYGVLKQSEKFEEIRYITIDQFRNLVKSKPGKQESSFQKQKRIIKQKQDAENLWLDYDWVIIITGVSVPGNYLGGKPIKFSELRKYSSYFPKATKFLCGPATKFGIGEEGGKPSIPTELLEREYNFIIKGDAEIVFHQILENYSGDMVSNTAQIQDLLNLERNNMDQIRAWAVLGSELILQHPNFDVETGGNLICEIESFRGCPRYISGGCSFCTEPDKGPTQHRSIEAIVEEITKLYSYGVRHFRIGNQTDFYAYQHGSYDNPRYPRPNPEAIKLLLQSIRDNCPELKTLHIDNVNALNFALYPEEAASITQAIVDLCTPGNVAAIGVESVDPVVIQKNNLKCTPDEILQAIEMINQYGAEVGTNGNPSFLPGLNFIMGLPGETAATLDANYQFLQDIYNLGLLIRRINLRKLLTPLTATQNQTIKEFTHDFEKDEKFYYHWKDQIREYIDFPMLKRVYPFGRILTNVFAEQHEGNGTYLRQVGTYPILCYAPKHLTLGKDYTLIIVDHGYRSLTCLEYPVDLIHLSLNELEHIPGIGKKRAVTIFTKQPNTESKWLGIVPKETLDSLKILQPNLY